MSLVLTSVQAREGNSRVTDSDDARMYLHTSRSCVTVSPSLTHESTHTHTNTHTHTHTHTLGL